MDMLGLKETIDQLATANGVRWYGHVQGVSQRYSPPLELNPKGLGKKQKYCDKLY